MLLVLSEDATATLTEGLTSDRLDVALLTLPCAGPEALSVVRDSFVPAGADEFSAGQAP